MALKFFVLLSILGVVTSFTVPAPGNDEQGQGETILESTFASSYSEGSPNSPVEIPQEDTTRDKRHLFKKWNKGKGETIVINRQYEQGGYGHGYDHHNHEVHHHHHYSNPPHYVDKHYDHKPAGAHEYHHYHGGYSGAYGGAGYNGGYGKQIYGDGGGYSHYGGAGGYVEHPPPIVTKPLAANYNGVDRGQGAAAVNNIAIINARAGASHIEADAKILPKPLAVDLDASSEGLHF